MKKRNGMVILLMSTMLLGIAGCGSQTKDNSVNTSEKESANTSSTDSEVINVRVAGTADYEPYTYVDKNEDITGYDIEIIKAIDKLAPEIKCTYTYTNWDTLLPGLDADKYDIVSNQLGKTDERQEMYLYPKNAFLFAGSSIISNENEPIETMEDLKGKKVGAIVGSSFTTQMEDYLKDHPNAFTMEYIDGTLPQMLDEIVNGRVDATINDPGAANSKAKVAGISDRIHISDKVYNGGASYFLFAKTDKGQEIADIVDKYLPELYYNGTMSKIAKEYLGTDSGVTSLPENGFYTQETLEEYQNGN